MDVRALTPFELAVLDYLEEERCTTAQELTNDLPSEVVIPGGDLAEALAQMARDRLINLDRGQDLAKLQPDQVAFVLKK